MLLPRFPAAVLQAISRLFAMLCMSTKTGHRPRPPRSLCIEKRRWQAKTQSIHRGESTTSIAPRKKRAGIQHISPSRKPLTHSKSKTKVPNDPNLFCAPKLRKTRSGPSSSTQFGVLGKPCLSASSSASPSVTGGMQERPRHTSAHAALPSGRGTCSTVSASASGIAPARS